jgi:hypothetical protein
LSVSCERPKVVQLRLLYVDRRHNPSKRLGQASREAVEAEPFRMPLRFTHVLVLETNH